MERVTDAFGDEEGPIARASRTAEAEWPRHWMSRDAAESARIVLIGSQPYHQVTVGEDDEHTLTMLRRSGYRRCLIVGDPQKPQLNRRYVYRKRAPQTEEDDDDGQSKATPQGPDEAPPAPA
jgi:hypothetical protein